MNLTVNGYNIFFIVIITFLTSVILIPFVKRIAKHIGAIDYPNERKVHLKPTPRLGGLAIFLAFLLGYMLFAGESVQMLSILIGGFIIVITGITDDIKPINPLTKLIGQFVAALIVVLYGGMSITEISAFGLYINFSIFSPVVTIIFIVAIINAINLIDGLDGLAGGISSIYFLTIAIIAMMLNKIGGLDVILCLIALGSTLGFLIYNFNPASVFLGDSGSMFLGYIISVIAILGFKNVTLTSLIIPIVILAIPILDAVLAFFRRALKHQSVGKADKEHLHHQLLKMKFSVKKTVLIIYAINIAFSAVSIFYVLGDATIAIVIYSILMILLLIFVLKTNILYEHKHKKEKTDDKED